MIYLKTRMRIMPKGCEKCEYYGSGYERNVYEPVCGAVSSRTLSVTPLPDYLNLEIIDPSGVHWWKMVSAYDLGNIRQG